MILASIMLGSAGAVLWRYPDPAEVIARRIPSLVLLGSGALFALWGAFLFIRQRPRTLPTDQIVIGVARLNPVGGARADAFGGEASEVLYHILREARLEGAPIVVRRVYARIPEAETDEGRMEAARRLARQPNIRVHLLVWGDVVVGRRRRFIVHTAGGHPAKSREFPDTWASDYVAMVRKFPDLSYADFLLAMCGDLFYGEDEHQNALACYRAVESVLAATIRGDLLVHLAVGKSSTAARKNLDSAVSEYERIIGNNPDLSGLNPWTTLRGRSEWNAVFGRLNVLLQNVSGTGRAELVDQYRAALSHARAGGFEGSIQELVWLRRFSILLQQVSERPEELIEAFHLAERVLHLCGATRQPVGNVLSAATLYLVCARDCFTATDEGMWLDTAERTIYELVEKVDREVAELLMDLCSAQLGLQRMWLDGNRPTEEAAQQLPTIVEACKRLLMHPHLGSSSERVGLLSTLGHAHQFWAHGLPRGPARRANWLEAAKALESARQSSPEISEGVISALSGVYLGIALDNLDAPADAAQFAFAAHSLLGDLLSDPTLLVLVPQARGPAHANLALSLWVLARYRVGERPMLLQQAREHALAAAALGIDPTPLLERLDALGTHH